MGILQIAKRAAVAAAILTAAPSARAASFTYTALEVPGHVVTSISGQPDALDDSDQVVGSTKANGAPSEGFVWQNGVFTLYPQAGMLAVINDGGLAIGRPVSGPGYLTIDTASGKTALYADGFRGSLFDVNDDGSVAAQQFQGQISIGYVLANGAKARIVVPGSHVHNGGTYPTAINASGTLAGYYSDANRQEPGFTYSAGVFTTFNAPDSVNTLPIFVTKTGVVGGSFTSTIAYAPVGFLRRADKFYAYLPSDGIASAVTGIGPGGEVVGHYEDSHIHGHGFIYSGGSFHPIDFPGAKDTAVQGVNARGSLVGTYTDQHGHQHAFIAQCPTGATCTQ